MSHEQYNCYVYALVDPINKLPFYIGKGQKNRAWDHVRGYDTKNKVKVKTIQLLRSMDIEPETHIIVNGLTDDQARLYEAECIKYSKSLGIKLSNVKTLEGSHAWSNESREKLSKTQKRKGHKPPSSKGKTWITSKVRSINVDNVVQEMLAGKTKKALCEELKISYPTLIKIVNEFAVQKETEVSNPLPLVAEIKNIVRSLT